MTVAEIKDKLSESVVSSLQKLEESLAAEVADGKSKLNSFVAQCVEFVDTIEGIAGSDKKELVVDIASRLSSAVVSSGSEAVDDIIEFVLSVKKGQFKPIDEMVEATSGCFGCFGGSSSSKKKVSKEDRAIINAEETLRLAKEKKAAKEKADAEKVAKKVAAEEQKTAEEKKKKEAKAEALKVELDALKA